MALNGLFCAHVPLSRPNCSLTRTTLVLTPTMQYAHTYFDFFPPFFELGARTG